MARDKRKILILVEGAKTDVTLMKKLLSVYRIDVKREIVSYCTNIYDLYRLMFEDKDPEAMDLLQILKSREPNFSKKKIFNDVYTDILLIFDLDPQAPKFTPEKINTMTNYFVESTDMGKLYINYPMVESFYHMVSIPDPNFNSYYATFAELKAKEYKARVNRENKNHAYNKFAATKDECSVVINQNIDKALCLVGDEVKKDKKIPEQTTILNFELDILKTKEKIAVLCTCAFFIPEYDSKLIIDKEVK